MNRAVPLLLPAAVALTAGALLDLGRIPAAALLGASLWVGLLLGRGTMPLQFAAFAMFGAVAFGFMAAVFASLVGLTVHGMLALPLSEQFVGITLAYVAVVLAALATCSGLWSMFARRGGN